jgi:hypothetical protein
MLHRRDARPAPPPGGVGGDSPMAKKRKSVKLRQSYLEREEDEARLRKRYGDEFFEALRDHALIHDFFYGQGVEDKNGQLVGWRFLESGSAREREARAAIVRVLTSVREFIPPSENPAEYNVRGLGPFVLDGLAKMIDPRTDKRGRKLVARTIGRQDWKSGWLIAGAVAREVKAGTKTAAAWQLVAERLGCSAKTVQRFWEKHKDEPQVE